MLVRSALATLLVLAALAAPASAQAPRTIAYQGVLSDGGVPVTSATSVTFSLFDAATAGTAQWTEVQTVTPDTDGVFAVRLGAVADFDDLDFGEPLWLQLAIPSGGGTLGPRTALDAAPYALGLYGVRVTPPTLTNDAPSIEAGHPLNEASGKGSVVAGGGLDGGSTPSPNRATGPYSAVGGGSDNTASKDHATVSGGRDNTASHDLSTIGGGTSNAASASYATVGGGWSNTASGTSATVAGGFVNIASGFQTTVSGGAGNTASGSSATVPGGFGNHARGSLSFAAGSRSRAIHDGTFVWSDNSQPEADSLISTGPAQFLIRATGGVGIGTNAPLKAEGVASVHIETTDLALQSSALENDEIIVEGNDAVIGLYSSAGGTWGSAVSFAEVNSTGALVDKWGIARHTTGGASGGLFFTFGTSDNYASNDAQMVIETDGDVHADGSFTGGGADFAEYLPVASSSDAPRAGDVVGVTAGRVGLATDQAEQVMIVSSNPAFVGNPDAAEGGALVALVGQAEVRLASATAQVGDLLVASGDNDGLAKAVSPARYDPAADGPVAGRVLALAEDGMAVALVGVDEAAALREVVVRQQDQIESLTARLDALERLVTSQTASR